MDDTTSGPPEADAILGSRRCQEVIDLLVALLCELQVSHTTKLALPATALGHFRVTRESLDSSHLLAACTGAFTMLTEQDIQCTTRWCR